MTDPKKPYIVVGENENINVIIESYYYRNSAIVCAKKNTKTNDYHRCMVYLDKSSSENERLDDCIMIFEGGRRVDNRTKNVRKIFNKFKDDSI